MKAALPANETARLSALHEYRIVDTLPEAAYDDLTRLASQLCDTPIALITLIDRDRQWFKAATGWELRETPREFAFCAHSILEPGITVVPDMAADQRFADNPFVIGEPHLRFYAGAPLITDEGFALGTICVADWVPRDLCTKEREALRALARQAMAQLQLRRQLDARSALAAQRKRTERVLRRQERQLAQTQELARLGSWEWNVRTGTVTWSDELFRIYGLTPGEFTPSFEGYLERVHPEDRARVRACIEEAVRTGHAWEFRKRILLPDGTIRMLRSVGDVILNKAGVATRLIGACQDITVQQEAEVVLRRSHEELELLVEDRTAELAMTNAALEEEIADRQRAEEALRQKTSELEAIFQALPDLFFRLDAEGRILTFKAGHTGSLYLPPKTFLGQPMQRVLPPAAGQQFVKALDELRGGAAVVCIEYCLPLPGGEREFEARMVPACDAQLVAIVRDITERKQSERELQRSEEHFRALIENGSDLIQIVDEQAVISYSSPSLRRILGYEPQQMTGHRATDHIYPDDLPDALEALRQVVAQPGVTRAAEYRVRHRDGSWRMFEAFGRTLAPDSAAEGVVVNARDVTERRAAEDALRKSEEQFRALIENAHDNIAIIDPTGTMTFQSPSVHRMLGYEPEELVGRSGFDFIHPEDVPRVAAELGKAFANPGTMGHAEYRFRHRDGSWRYLEAFGQRLPASSGSEGIVANIRDVTDRVQTAEALRQAKEEAEAARAAAEAANRAKSEFLSRMSHELRTPMNSILGFAQLLSRKELPPDQHRAVNHIFRAGRHLLNLINEVLDIARIEADQQQLSLEPVRVFNVLQEALSLVRPLAAQRGCTIEETSVDGDPYVHADRQRLAQVLLNLLSNAVKYNQPGGRVTLLGEAGSGAAGEPRFSIGVRDTGPGIPPERMAELFTPFARLGAEQTEIEGTGLGLALSKRLTEAMGGRLRVESVPGEGSTFWVDLLLTGNPLDRLTVPATTESTPDTVSTQTATLLYVEDNLANLNLIESILATRPQLTLVPALQGRLGLELAREHAPDLILLDLHLPDIPGDEVLRRLREDPQTRDTPVVVISADATPGRIQRLRECGANEYLTKPLDVDQFLATIDHILSERGNA